MKIRCVITKSDVLKFLKNNWLTIATFASVVLGVGVGLILRKTKSWSPREIMYWNYVGEVFLRMLKCLILPLISTSLITGIASLNLGLSRNIGGRAVAFYLTTTFLSVVLGISLVVWIKPGIRGGGVANETTAGSNKQTLTVDTLLDLLRNFFAPNMVQACIEQYSTKLSPPKTNSNAS